MEIWGYPLPHILYCEAAHFGLGFLAGLLGYLLISTTTAMAGRSTLSSWDWLFVISLSIASHVLEDYLLGWF